ncbi:hypothetical protein KOR42_28550 [Thalassoglobus neptunius]|uniref:Uncharacterized protein n=1 Tax=Thalassoglobus neptunius TaxID=1938619 RepID=A0A5C5WYW9_9PLAN|nr:zinc ribbon domain-containing protein [Thalassoglobus neptunius]TWT55469.1 hypothetical protein KOR42_28550 [Thalassoglobus neptunius]
MRTKAALFARACVVVFLIYLPLSWFWNWATETRFWTPFEMFVSAILTVLFFGGIAWLITNVGMSLLFGRNAEYERYKTVGGDSFIDSMPRLPKESSWQFECPVCGAPVEHRIDICGQCGYGSETP